MSTYTPVKRLLPTGLDEVGIELGLQRLPNETLENYKKRLWLETRAANGPTQKQFVDSLARQVGVFDVPVFEIDLILDGSDEPLAADPYIEITSTYFRAYDDYENGSIDIELNLLNKTDGRFLRDIYNDLDASSYFSVTVLDSDYTYKLSKNLRFGNSLKTGEQILLQSKSNKLENMFLKEFFIQDRNLFQNEVGSEAAILELGDYYVDYTNSVIFTWDTMGGVCTYTYNEFPYRLWWQQVRTWPLGDEDKKYLMYDVLIEHERGEDSYVVLNSEGAEIYNEVLGQHSLSWGK